MPARLFHGALVGALLAGVAGWIESLLVLARFPYHRDFGLWLEAMPRYFGAGAVLGLVAALGLPLLTRRRDRASLPGLFLACPVLAAMAALVCLLRLHTAWLPESVPSLSPRGLGASAGILLGGGILFLILRQFARGRWGWMAASFFSPPGAISGCVTLLFLAWIGWMMPVLPASGAGPAPPPARRTPNVLLVVLDTVGAGHLGCYGSMRATSPAIDSIAREGVLFENAFAAAPWTLPSHASLFTGLHSTTHRTGWEHPRLDDGAAEGSDSGQDELPTLAEELDTRGYDTCGVSEKAWISHATGLTRGFSKYWDFSSPPPLGQMFLFRLEQALRKRFGAPLPAAPDKGAARIIDRSLDWLGGGRGRDPKRPFFLFLNLNEAHDPFRPPEGFENKFLPEGIQPVEAMKLDQSPTFRKKFICGRREFEKDEPEILRSLYDAEILYEDTQLARLFKGLRDMDLMEDTLVILTSDHGEEFGEHGVLGHQLLLTDGMLHVPLILRYPEKLAAGTRVPGLASLVDIFPTVIDLLEEEGNAAPRRTPGLLALEGVSLLPAARPGGEEVRDFILAHYQNPARHLASYPCWDASDPGASPLWARYARSLTIIRTENEKFLRRSDGSRDYFDLNADPREKSGAARTPPGLGLQALSLEHRLDQQLNRTVQRRMLLFDPLKHNRPAAVGTQALEQTGYTGPASSASGIPQLPDLSPRIGGKHGH